LWGSTLQKGVLEERFIRSKKWRINKYVVIFGMLSLNSLDKKE
jgi:hypothetical protein